MYISAGVNLYRARSFGQCSVGACGRYNPLLPFTTKDRYSRDHAFAQAIITNLHDIRAGVGGGGQAGDIA